MKQFPLFRKMLSRASLNDVILPYNLNWLNRDWNRAAAFLRENPLNVVDIGARGGSVGELDPLKGFINYFAFDADAVEAARLQRNTSHGFRSLNVFPYFIGDCNGLQQFYLFKSPGFHSSLLPSERCLQFEFPGFEIDRTVRVDARTLDTVMASNGEIDIDVIKLDTQGTEFDILANATDSLEKALLVEVEVEFFEMYKGQKLFSDICALMAEKGFDLLYLNRAFATRSAYRGQSRGQLIFGDALFGRSDHLAEQLPPAKKAKYVVALIQYGHMDLAHQLYKQDEKVRDLIPGASRYFNLYGDSKLVKLKRLAVMQLDKVIALLLHARGTNQRGSDSDRNWPIR
jgi:FkbM family methyltransferase